MNDPRVDNQPVSLHQKMNRLCRVDRDCELRFDERSVVAQVDNSGGLAQLERSPQDANHFESNTGASVAERSHGLTFRPAAEPHRCGLPGLSARTESFQVPGSQSQSTSALVRTG